MRDTLLDHEILDSIWEVSPIDYFRRCLEDGKDWPGALVEAMALWSLPVETIDGVRYTYFIDGEAFDWLLLAQRLCEAVGNLIPPREKEDLLFSGQFPQRFEVASFKELLGSHKYRGFLNYFYGVVVEESLHLATEREVHKRHLSNGNQYQDDFSEEAYSRIYRESKSALIEEFRLEKGYLDYSCMTLPQTKEFTYWLFKFRMKTADKAKIASDTRKGLQQFHQLTSRKDRTPFSLL